MAEMRRIDRALLATAYILLVAVVVYLVWDVDRQLSQAAQERCYVAWAELSSDVAIFTLVVSLVDTDSLDEAAREDVLDTALNQAASVEYLQEVCGAPPAGLSSGDEATTLPLDILPRLKAGDSN